jgi:hypothetical protein
VGDDYTHTLDADLTANFSGPFNAYLDSEQNLDSITFDKSWFDFNTLTSIQNRGLGLDLGATYKLLNDKLMVSASLTDLGYIKWNREVTNLTAKGQFVFNGLDMTDVLNGTKDFEDVGKELLDSLKDSFNLVKTNAPFTTWLAPGLTLGGSFNLNKSISFGLLSYSRFIGKQVRESLTLSANVNLSNAFSFSLGYSLQNQRADNLGAGIAFRASIFQFYFISDRIPVSWDRLKVSEKVGRLISLNWTEQNHKDQNRSIYMPSNWNTLNLRLGMNLSFGNKGNKKNDKPMIQNEQTF